MSESLTIDREQAAETNQSGISGRVYGFAPSMVMKLNPNAPQAAGIRSLRTHVMAQHINHGRRALAVCGPGVGVGCSFVAANLAISLSQIGMKTLLIDGDLRHPMLDQMIRPPHPSSGLIGCLLSPEAPFAPSIEAGVLPNLSIIYAGQPVINSQELLAGDRFKALMNFCLREFDATIVDTPPANTSTDARRIGGVVGYSLIVTAKDLTLVKDVKTLTNELRADGCVPIGTVLNQA
jgi:protein-tyrosine kinase